MARNINVSWSLPTTRESGKPLNPADIAEVTLDISVDNVNWSFYNTFGPSVLSTVLPEMDYGEWFVRGIVKDTGGRASQPVVKSVVVPDTTAPGPLSLSLSL
jgi:hypothetical protein